MSYHIFVKKHRGLFRLELALWTRIAVFLYACYMCHIIFLLRNNGNRIARNWLSEPVLRLNKRLSSVDAGDLKRHHAHYDVTVTFCWNLISIPLACINSLPTNGANYNHIRQQWPRRWLVAFGPKPLPEPMATWDYWHFITFAMHGTYDNHP